MKIGSIATASTTDVEDGTYTAIPYSIIYLGTQKYLGEEKKSESFNITFELPDVTADFDGKIKPRVKSTEIGISYTDKSKLPGIVKAITGVNLSEEEIKNFDLDTLLGKPCMISLATNEKGKQKIVTISKLMKSIKAPKQYNPNSILGYEKATWDKAKFDKLPEWLQENLKQVKQYAPCLGLIVETSGFANVETKDEEVPF